MSTVLAKAEVKLVDPTGKIYSPVSGQFSNVVDQGIQWSAVLAEKIPVNWADEDVWTLVVRTEEGTWTSCPLVATKGTQTRGTQWLFNIGGTDLFTHRMNVEGLTLNTFTNQTASSIMTSIASVARVSIAGVYSSLPSYQVQEFDVQGYGWGQHLVRLGRDGGYDWRINDQSGVMQFFPINAAALSSQTIYTRDTQETTDVAGVNTRIRMRKTSKLRSDFNFGLQVVLGLNETALGQGSFGENVTPNAIFPTDTSTMGFIQEATFFDASNNVVAYFKFDPSFPNVAVTSSAPAVKCVFLGHAPTFIASTQSITCIFNLHVHAIPVGGGGFDFGVETFYPLLPAGFTLNQIGAIQREKVYTLESPLWATQAQMTALAPLFLMQANKETHTVNRVIKFNPLFTVGEVLSADQDVPAARYDNSNWQFGPGGVSHNIKGWVQSPLPILKARGVPG